MSKIELRRADIEKCSICKKVEDMSPAEAVQAIHDRPDYPGQSISGGGRTFSPAKPAGREVRR